MTLSSLKPPSIESQSSGRVAPESTPGGLPKPPSFLRIGAHTAATAAVLVLLGLVQLEDYGALLVAPFAASAMLAIAAPDLSFSQPRAIVGGNVIAAFCGVLAAMFLDGNILPPVAAASAAIGLMFATRTAHAPAAATAIVAASAEPSWWFIAFPVLAGTIVVVLFAAIYHRALFRHAYPKTWI